MTWAAPTAAALGLVLLLGACSADPVPPGTMAAPESTPAPVPSPSPSTMPTATPSPPERSRLSGRTGRGDGPVFAVKLDNTASAHPQVGLRKADVVYVEEVEGGVTRLAAIYSSAYPSYVGPVRSARISDIQLLKQYGRVGLIYSGSQTRLFDNLGNADLALVSFDADRSGYTRSAARVQPYDVIGDVEALRKRAGRVDKPPEVGYSFGPAPKGGRRARQVTIHFPMARVGAAWSASQDRWLLSMDGLPDQAAEGGRLGPTTLIAQFVTVRPSAYHDINGANTPLTETVGRGKALFFRDGKVWKGRWRRDYGRQPTSYLIGGKPAVFAPGQLWVTLIGRDQPVTVD